MFLSSTYSAGVRADLVVVDLVDDDRRDRRTRLSRRSPSSWLPLRSGGSSESRSVTADAVTEQRALVVGLELRRRVAEGLAVRIRRSATGSFEPWFTQLNETAPAASVTGSLKVTDTASCWRRRWSRRWPGSSLDTGRGSVGRESSAIPGRRTCRPRSRPTRPPDRTRHRRSSRRPGSRPCAGACGQPCSSSPVPHSVPGLTPIWPMTSMRVTFLTSATASLPLNQPAALSRLAVARMAGAAEALATTYTSAVVQRSREIDRGPGVDAAIEEHLQAVAGEVDGSTGPVVDLDGLVVARPLDVLGEEQVSRRSEDRRRGGGR